MKMKLAAAFAALSLVVPAAAQTTVFANSGSLPGDSFTNAGGSNTGQAVGTSGWHYNNVRNSGIVGVNTTYARSGNGSLYFETTLGPSGASSKADAEFFLTSGSNSNGNFFATSSLGALSALTSLSYDWYRDSSSTATAVQQPALRLQVVSADLTQSGYLIFERAYNGSTVPTDTWVSDDIYANRATYNMWSTGSLPGAFSNFTTTLDQWMTSSMNYQVIGISTGVGSGWGPFRGAVDNIQFGFGGQNTTYNFEAVPEPMTMTVMALGALAALRKKRKA
jgi:hypothetical protein